jgi:CBS domain-containing protein
MSVGRIAVRAVSTGYPAESVRAAAKRMKAHGVGATVVIDDDVRPIGIVTDRDVALRCVAEERDPDLTQLGDIMSTPVSAVTEDGRRVRRHRRADRQAGAGVGDGSPAPQPVAIRCGPATPALREPGAGAPTYGPLPLAVARYDRVEAGIQSVRLASTAGPSSAVPTGRRQPSPSAPGRCSLN